MCNCSICRRKNAVMLKVHESKFTAPSGPRLTVWCNSTLRPSSPMLKTPLAQSVQDEFDAFLACGILAHGSPRRGPNGMGKCV
jgi:hypothetical protein